MRRQSELYPEKRCYNLCKSRVIILKQEKSKKSSCQQSTIFVQHHKSAPNDSELEIQAIKPVVSLCKF